MSLESADRTPDEIRSYLNRNSATPRSNADSQSGIPDWQEFVDLILQNSAKPIRQRSSAPEESELR